MTRLALNLSGYINAVAERHQGTAARMSPGYPIRAITNGVHPASWTHPAFGRLFDRLGAHCPHEPELLGRADPLPDEDVRAAHAVAKAELIATIREPGGPAFDPAMPILAFARRMTGYKRPHLLLDDPDRLAAMARRQPLRSCSPARRTRAMTAEKSSSPASTRRSNAWTGPFLWPFSRATTSPWLASWCPVPIYG
jgi:starch phosphorylase